MTRYLSVVLKNLEKVYRFTSSQLTAPEEIELGVPIQLVHDVSRDSKFGSGAGQNEGYWILHAANTHTVPGTLTFAITPTDPTNRLNGFPAYDPDKFQLWVMRGWMDVTSLTQSDSGVIFLNHASSSIGPTGAATAQVARDNIIWVRGTVETATLGFPTGASSAVPQSQSLFNPIPLLQRNDGAAATIGFSSTADGAGNVAYDFNVLFWLGRRGATPPGLA